MVDYGYPVIDPQVEDALTHLRYATESGFVGLIAELLSADLEALAVVRRWIERVEMEMIVNAHNGAGITWEEIAEELLKVGLIEEPKEPLKPRGFKPWKERRRIAIRNKVRNTYADRRRDFEKDGHLETKEEYWLRKEREAREAWQATHPD